MQLAIAHHIVQLLQHNFALFRIILNHSKLLQLNGITGRVKQHSIRWKAIAARTAGLLVLALDVFGHIHMHHITHV